MGRIFNIKNTIVLIPFPFDDFSSTKVRPALCLTNEIGDYNHIIVAFISSQIPSIPLSSDVLLKKNKLNNLKVDSVLRIHRIVTIPRSLIKKRLGRLDSDVFKMINKKIIEIFNE